MSVLVTSENDDVSSQERTLAFRPKFRAVCLCLAMVSSPAIAQSDEDGRIAQLEQRIAEQDARIAQLEQAIQAMAGSADTAVASAAGVSSARPEQAELAEAQSRAATPIAAQGGHALSDRLSFAGDLRLRQEFNWSDNANRDRSRNALRARLKAVYQPSRHLEIGARLVTGNEDDPNSADVTIGDFANDMTVSLDQAYVTGRLGPASVSGGKFALPFDRTDLVWDGDFNPYGAGGDITLPLAGDAAKVRLAGLYSIISEDAAARGSDMLGGQVTFALTGRDLWSASIAAGYYDYRLTSLSGADSGDFRSNLRRLDGSYLSDFDIVDLIARLQFGGLGEAWPVQLTAEAVRNLGADKDVRDAFHLALALGRMAKTGDTKLSYGYFQAEADAVFAAFSHDNITLATNYRMHEAALEHQLSSQFSLSLLWYHYQALDALYATPNQTEDWVDRMRINAVFSF